MTNNNSSRMEVPQAKEAMDKFKMEVANELGVPLKNGYNGDLTSKQNGSVGGEMVRQMIKRQEQEIDCISSDLSPTKQRVISVICKDNKYHSLLLFPLINTKRTGRLLPKLCRYTFRRSHLLENVRHRPHESPQGRYPKPRRSPLPTYTAKQLSYRSQK